MGLSGDFLLFLLGAGAVLLAVAAIERLAQLAKQAWLCGVVRGGRR